MTTSEFQPGDRVRVTREGTVQFTDQGGDRLYFWRPDAPLAWCRSDEATLIERPMPPLPTTFGSSIVATVRGVPNVLLVRTNYTPSSAQYNWLSGTPVDDARWHTDSHITEWRPWVSLSDTTTLCPDSGMSRFACQASDICDCFEPRVVPAEDIDPIAALRNPSDEVVEAVATGLLQRAYPGSTNSTLLYRYRPTARAAIAALADALGVGSDDAR